MNQKNPQHNKLESLQFRAKQKFMKRFRNLLIVSVGLAALGFFLDSDNQLGTIWLSIFEFAAMTLLILVLLSICYFTFQKVKQAIS
jgi:hypothetical protein